MWSPTKLDFLFYEIFVIYYDFSNISVEINKKGKDKTTVTVAKPPSKTVWGLFDRVWKVQGVESLVL